MKLTEIYAMPHIHQRWDDDDDYAKQWKRTVAIETLTGGWHNHLPEVGDENVYDIVSDRVSIRIHLYEGDGYRVAVVGSAWFDGRPIMVFRHAGRSGHDHYDRFITDVDGFRAMVAHIVSILPQKEVADVWDPDQEIDELDSLYGHSMKGA